jgi:hypothetical protein
VTCGVRLFNDHDREPPLSFTRILRAADAIRRAENRNLFKAVHLVPIDKVDERFHKLSQRYNIRGWVEHKRALRLILLQRRLDAARPAFVAMGYTGKEFDEYRNQLLAAANALSHWDVGLDSGKRKTLERQVNERFAERLANLQLELQPVLHLIATSQGTGPKTKIVVPRVAVADNEYLILRALRDKHPRLVLLADLAADTGLTLKTCSRVVRTLRDRGLVQRPSQRKGATISLAGEALLAAADRAC